jgi:hypothetical protein
MFTTVLQATYTNQDGDKLEFLFTDYAEFKERFKLHDELIEEGFELEFEDVLSTRDCEYEDIEDIEELEYKDC